MIFSHSESSIGFGVSKSVPSASLAHQNASGTSSTHQEMMTFVTNQRSGGGKLAPSLWSLWRASPCNAAWPAQKRLMREPCAARNMYIWLPAAPQPVVPSRGWRGMCVLESPKQHIPPPLDTLRLCPFCTPMSRARL